MESDRHSRHGWLTPAVVSEFLRLDERDIRLVTEVREATGEDMTPQIVEIAYPRNEVLRMAQRLYEETTLALGLPPKIVDSSAPSSARTAMEAASVSEASIVAQIRALGADQGVRPLTYEEHVRQRRTREFFTQQLGVPWEERMVTMVRPCSYGPTSIGEVPASEAGIEGMIRALGADTGPRPRTYEEYVAEREAENQREIRASGHLNITGHSLDNATRRLARHDMTPKERMIHKIRTALQSKNYPEDKIHKYLRGLKLIE